MKSQDHPEQFAPFPEIVEGRPRAKPYRVVDTYGKKNLPTNGMVNKVERKIYIPLRKEGRHVARHELAHVKWSPTRMFRVDHDPRAVMAVEDARINMGLACIGLPVLLNRGECATVASLGSKDLERGDVKCGLGLALYLVVRDVGVLTRDDLGNGVGEISAVTDVALDDRGA